MGVPPLHPDPHKNPQQAKRSLTDNEMFYKNVFEGIECFSFINEAMKILWIHSLEYAITKP